MSRRRPGTFTTSDIEVNPEGHDLEGEPARAPRARLRPAPAARPAPFPLAERARERVMRGERSTKLSEVGALPDGTTYPETPGAESPEQAPSGSILPVVAASRLIPPTEDLWSDLVKAGNVLAPPYDPWLLVCAVEESDSLPPLIDAMATNLSGYGIELEPLYPTRDPETGEELEPPPDAASEEQALRLWLLTCNVDLGGLEAVIELTDRDIETTGSGYIEVLRDKAGREASWVHAESWTMRLGRLSELILVQRTVRDPTSGELVTVPQWRRFRTYVQIRDNAVRYFKEYRDPRSINVQTGQYKPEGERWGEGLDGTEILFRRVYSAHTPYGVPRWIGALIHSRAGRAAAEVILGYLHHAPIGVKLAMVSGGRWAANNLDEINDKIDDTARGVENAFAVVGLEATPVASMDDDGTERAPAVALADLAPVIPDSIYKGKDSILESSASRVRRQFRLPPLYTGNAEEYSHASVRAARGVTEEQLFVPLRLSRWVRYLNVSVLPGMGISHYALRMQGANTSDDGETAKGLAPLIAGGGASPNALIRFANKLTGQSQALIPEGWGDRPLALVLELLRLGKDPNDELGTPEAGEGEGAEGGEGVEGAAPGEVLTGIQVTSALEIIAKVASGELPEGPAMTLLQWAFHLDETTAAGLIEGLDDSNVPDPMPVASPFGGPDPDLDADPDAPVAKRRHVSRKVAAVVWDLYRIARQLDGDAVDLELEPPPSWS